MKMISKNAEKDKKDTIYNVSKIIKYCNLVNSQLRLLHF